MSRGAAKDATASTGTVPVLLLGGLVLLIGMGYVAYLAERFVYGSPMLERPIFPFISAMIILGLVYAGCVYGAVRGRAPWWVLLWILAVGTGMRLLFLGSNPILESDFYRYMWDGAVTVSGHNPYAYVPADVFDGQEGVPEALTGLARESGTVAGRVNHARLGTIYPPVAQSAFAVAHAIAPWSQRALRGVLFGFDLAAFALVVVLLRSFGRPLHWSLIYWWNPVLIKETANGMHMDVIVLPLVLLALLFASKSRPVLTCVSGALAVCAKVWPVVLAPLLLRNTGAKGKGLAVAVLAGTVVLLAVASPMYAAVNLNHDSGFYAYGERWEMNDALFMVFHKAAQYLSAALGGEARGGAAKLGARVAVGLVLLGLVGALSRRPAVDGADLANRVALVIGAMFMLSPTQYPWYYPWLVPFLAIAPRASLLALTVTLPMYYLKFYYVATDEADFFHNRIVWVEYAPVFALAAWEAWRAFRARGPSRA